MYILVINLGSTSSKVALYEDGKELEKRTYSHSKEELAGFAEVNDQFDYRCGYVTGFLDEIGFSPEKLDCVVSRGGAPPNVRTGATILDDKLSRALLERPMEPQPACLSAPIGYRIAQGLGIPAFVIDPITANELNPLARIFGVKGIEHESFAHVLNTRAMSIAAAKDLGRPFEECSFVAAHFGGGNSLAMWYKGLLHDTVPGDFGALSAERCGFVRNKKLLELTREYDYKTIMGWYHGKGGMVSLLGTNDLREVERMVEEGDEYATLCAGAMAYQLSKSIASLFPTVNGDVDGVVLTGGGAYWGWLVDEIKKRVAFLNVPVFVKPGENEMQALADGALRVMRGEEIAHTYEG